MKAKCGGCHRYVKTVPVIGGEKDEVEFVCKKCGVVNSFVEFERPQRGKAK